MQLIDDIYLGWSPLHHGPTCAQPTWDKVEVRHDLGARIVQTGAEHHTCANDDCRHSDTFGRVQVRLLCRDCGTVATLTGENLTTVFTPGADSGWTQAPREVAGVWLWPGQPALPSAEPHDYLVTREPADTVTIDNVYGLITRHRDATGAPHWIAAALPDPAGPHQVHTLRWRHRTSGITVLAEAAAWIAAADTRAQRPLVVAV
ncbi:hypothetical protein [Streptomyces sp. NPDC001914]|uniref:hypothetical protein n=1 Tax=Streptomyces sp. NPDC001914 TaxID=3364623 RepID=UPI0036B829A5